MAVLYEGSTPRFLLRIRDGSGVQLNPNLSAGQVTEVKVWIYNSITGAIIAKRYLNTPPSPLGIWTQMTTKEVTSGDHRIQISLTAAETTDKTPNANEIQVELIYLMELPRLGLLRMWGKASSTILTLLKQIRNGNLHNR